MAWLLVLSITGMAQTVSVPVGLLINKDACNIAGLGMSAVLEQQVPDVSVSWTCSLQVAA